MRHVRTLTLCLVAMLALAAFGSAAAWAKEKLPAWGQCEPTPGSTGGKYGNAGCTAPVKKVKGHYLGGYEWYPLAVESVENRSDLYYTESNSQTIPQPVTESSVTFADGQKITCAPLLGGTQLPLTGPDGTTLAPDILFSHCFNVEGEQCASLGAVTEIGSVVAFEHGLAEEPGTWKGAMAFVEGKNTADPTAGLVYETEHPNERFMAILCKGGHPQTISVGGHTPDEELTTTMTPVNTMSESFTASWRQSNGVQLPARLEGHKTRPLEAQVNLGEWQTVGFEATMLFPVAEARTAYRDDYSRLELKATP